MRKSRHEELVLDIFPSFVSLLRCAQYQLLVQTHLIPKMMFIDSVYYYFNVILTYPGFVRKKWILLQ